jgi:cytochrome c
MVAAVSAAACQARSTGTPAEAPRVEVTDRIPAGGALPAANALGAPRPEKLDPQAGEALFSSMNCDGCHGGGGVGWVGPSLVDGRWRYGGADDEIFSSIYYGRPKGMPAYGGVVGTDGAWMLVEYIKAQAVPPVVPTTSWLPGGNAEATLPAPTPPGPAAEEKASPSGAQQAATGGPGRASAGEPSELIAKYGCTGCHAIDHRVVGPAFKEVAAKYRSQQAEDRLVEKVRRGGAGVWGSIPMAPNPQVPDAELHAIVRWILTLQ